MTEKIFFANFATMNSLLPTKLFLVLCTLLLAIMCLLSIRQPLTFQNERARREKVVASRLLLIRSAEMRYKAAKGVFCASFDTLVHEGWIADSLQFIPDSGGKRFTLSTTVLNTLGGQTVPVMECGALYDDFLQGMDRRQIELLNQKAISAGAFPGMKFGDLTKNNDNATNWN